MLRGAHRAAVRRRARIARALVWLLPLSWAAFAASVALRPEPGSFDARFDVVLYNLSFLLAAAACWFRASGNLLDREAWRTLGVGLAVYAAGNVYGSLVVGDQDTYPSLADVLWLSYYLCAYVAIVLLVRSRVPTFHRSAWLDGAVGGCGAAALSAEFLFSEVMDHTDGRYPVVATNLAYPVLQVLLIMLLVTTGYVVRSRGWSWWLLTAGVAVAFVGDVVFLYQEAGGTYQEGGPLDLTWPLGATLLGLAALVRTQPSPAAREPVDAIAFPAVFSLAALGLLVYGQAHELNPVALVLALLTVGLGSLRFLLTLREPTDPSRRRVRLLSDLRTALDREDLTLHFQPKVDLRTGTVTGVEALLRWAHPRHGPIAPDEFLGLAEQTNLMPDITRFVLRLALVAATALGRAGFPLTMSVNLSSSDLMDSGLPARVERLLVEHDLPAERLVVEVTENSVMADRTRALGVLRQLREGGVRVSVDDYGTGHASLAYLRELPVDELKLDRSFLVGVPHDIHNAAIVRSTVELAHALDLSIVAEGVEDADCQAWLRRLGCDVGQGFHISHPMPFEDLLSWLRTEPADVADVAEVAGSGPIAHLLDPTLVAPPT